LDYSISSNSESAPSFNTTSINSKECADYGNFSLEGELLSNLEEDLTFELPIYYPENLTASCSIGKKNRNEKTEIKCELNGEINDEEMMIIQNTIFDSKGKELLIINKTQSKEKIKCKNAKDISLKKKLNLPIIFRQVSNFRPSEKFVYFYLVCLTSQDLENKIITLLVNIININLEKEKKEKKEINCTLISKVNVNNGYVPAKFNCTREVESKPNDIEIISSNDISGITDKLQDYQKSPNQTDLKIKETENESSDGLGKEIDYFNNDEPTPNTLEITSINLNKCQEKGKIRISGVFAEKNEQKIDFEIPLSYPSSSLKCTAPQTEESNMEVSMDCKVQKEFYNSKQITIEQTIVKKKNKEIFLIKSYNTSISRNCSDYNKIQEKNENEKYNSNYTFIQTNSFTNTGNGIFFKIILLYLFGDFKTNLPIKFYFIRKSSRLRYLDVPNYEEEQESNCVTSDSSDVKYVTYNCNNNNVKINNLSEIENFYFESTDTPLSGLNEENSNPIQVDDDIKNNKALNFSSPEILNSEIPVLNDTIFDESNCSENGSFNLKGKLIENDISENEDVDIYFSYPIDKGGLCKYPKGKEDDNMTIVCQNKEDFEGENIRINTQLIGGRLLVNKTINDGIFSCVISSQSLYKGKNPETTTTLTDSTIVTNIYPNSTFIDNNYYKKKSSSNGLNGGAIAAIVIVSAVALIAVGVLIAFIKNGLFLAPKIPMDSTIQAANSSTQIV